MKKRMIAAICVAMLAVTGSIAIAASKSDEGGYPYMSDGKIDFTGYFTVEGAQMELGEEALDFVLQGEVAEVTFNKPLASDNFQLNFAGVEGSTLKSAEFFLSDSENEEETVKIAYNRMSAVQTSIAVNDATRSFITTGSLYKENDGVFTVAYQAESNTFGDGMVLVIPAPETVDGEGFLGFTSHKANLTIRLTGEKGSVFRLKSINQQRIGSKYTEDDTAPMISIINPVSSVTKGATITLPTAFASDVLADNASVTMTVKDNDGEIAKATDGTKLEDVSADKAYRLKAEQYGTYRVEFKATDGTNSTRAVVSRIDVADNSAPEITLDSTLPTSHKVGEKLMFPTATCTDNVSKADAITLHISVKHPNGTFTAESKSVELTEEGVYEITYMAVDEAGNIARKTVKTYAEGEK